LHYEVELGVVIGKTVRDLDESDTQGALDAIESKTNQATIVFSRTSHEANVFRSSGYIVAIDFTARNVQDEAKKKGLPWSTAKGFDTFCPISHIIPKGLIPDPHNATLWLSVNDVMRQNDSTALMLFQIPRQLQDISRVMTLEKGDIVLTGTPKGVGTVKSGDVLKCGIQIDGNEIKEGKIEVEVADRGGPYEFKQT
jgi:acylpyruvate hydrolase